MKTFMLFASLFCFTLTSNAQQLVEVSNSTNCDLVVQMYSVVSGSCQYTGAVNYYLSPGQGITAIANPGEEWIYAEISSVAYCNGSFGLAVGTPMQCSSTCSWNTPSNVVISNNGGCNSCLPNIMADGMTIADIPEY